MKKKKESVQFRYNNLPEDSYVFAKLGPSWIREYGKGIDYLHFHNILEIGVCRAGTGDMIFREDVCPYEAGDIAVFPVNIPIPPTAPPVPSATGNICLSMRTHFCRRFLRGSPIASTCSR